MPTTNEYTQEESLLASTPKLMYTWSALQMAGRGATRGYYAPIPGIKMAGRRFGAIKDVRNLWYKSAIGPVKGKAARQALSRVGIGTAAKAAFGKTALKKGAGAIARSIGTKLLISKVAGMVIPAFHIWFATELLSIPFQAYSGLAQQVQSYRGLELGGYFPETKGSLTSRQRTVRAITDSRLQARSAIGNEAFLYHR